MSKTIKKFNLTKLDIVGICLIVLFLPIIIINLVLVVKGAMNPEKIPMIFDTAPLIVVSDSMTIDEKNNTGAFNKGDLIVIKKVNPDDLVVGDIITYISKEGDIITHRITEVLLSDEGVRTFETKGDASPGFDYYAVKYDQIIGKYNGVRLANLGDVAMFFQTPAGVIAVIGIPLVGMLAFDIVKKQQESKAAKSREEELEAEIERLKKSQNEQN